MLTKNQNTAFWLFSVFGVLAGLRSNPSAFSVVLGSLIGIVLSYSFFRAAWWVFDRIKPIRPGQNTTMRMVLAMFSPALVALVVAIIYLSLRLAVK
jgi:hypothetical protein